MQLKEQSTVLGYWDGESSQILDLCLKLARAIQKKKIKLIIQF